MNVLDNIPLSVQANMKKDLREVYRARSRAAAEAEIDIFAEKYRAVYGRAVDCLIKNHDARRAAYGDHFRTSPLKSLAFLLPRS